jgi:hypothetical protein
MKRSNLPIPCFRGIARRQRLTPFSVLKSFFLHVGLVASLMSIPSQFVFCGENVMTSEKEKLLSIFRAMEYTQRSSFGNPSECEAIFRDLKANRNFEIIEPLIRTDDYAEPSLRSYLGKCPALELNKIVSYEPRIWEDIKDLPAKEQERFGSVSVATKDFRLYRVDIDNDPKNGDEYIFYGGGVSVNDHKTVFRGSAYFTVLNLEDCKKRSYRQVEDTIFYDTGNPTGNYNGIIKHGVTYYILGVGYSKNERSYRVTFYQWKRLPNNTRIESFGQRCYFTANGRGGQQ